MGLLQLDASGVSRDPEVVAAYLDDPLVYNGKVSARLVSELFAAMNHLLENASSIELPVLIMQGEADSLVAVEGSRLLHDSISSRDKSLILYARLYHEIFNEPERDQVLSDLESWLQARLPVSIVAAKTD